MFAVFFSAAAAPPSLPGLDVAPSLGPYPILQAAVGLAAFLAGLYMMLRGEKSGEKKKGGGDSDVHMHFDGPMAEAMRQIKRLADAAEQMPKSAEQLAAFMDHLHTFRDELKRDIESSRHKTMGDVQRDVIVRFEHDIDELDKRLRHLAETVSEMRGAFSTIAELKNLITARRRSE